MAQSRVVERAAVLCCDIDISKDIFYDAIFGAIFFSSDKIQYRCNYAVL